MSNCEHSDFIYAFCVACELAKREKLIVELQSQLSQVQGELEKMTADRDRWADMYEDLLKRTKDLAKEVELMRRDYKIVIDKLEEYREALEKIAFGFRDITEMTDRQIAIKALSSNEKA